MTHGQEARLFIRAQHYGVLATLSKKLDGYPFGSIVPYVLDEQARPIILISTLAEHTKNIDHDHRVSLLIHEYAEDVQANARMTLVGDAARMEDQVSPRERYLRYFPNAEGYFATHDFFFYRIEPKQFRFIGGFGAIHWIPAEGYVPPPNEIALQEAGILAHMNQDHGNALLDYCRHFRGMEATEAVMIGVDCDGFDIRADGKLLRFNFEQPVLDMQAIRQALVAMAAAAREGSGATAA